MGRERLSFQVLWGMFRVLQHRPQVKGQVQKQRIGVIGFNLTYIREIRILETRRRTQESPKRH